MIRKKNSLYFEPHESSRFLRAIKLYGILKKTPEEEIIDDVKHEEDHIKKYHELGCGDKITGYKLEASKKGVTFSVYSKGLTNKESVETALAPKRPSSGDFFKAVKNPKRFYKMLDEVAKGENFPENLKKLALNEMRLQEYR